MINELHSPQAYATVVKKAIIGYLHLSYPYSFTVHVRHAA